jgi:hypothetical protein
MPNQERFIECGCCGAWHRENFAGDCRQDDERFNDPPDGADYVTLDEQMESEE